MIIKLDQPDSKRFNNRKGGGVNTCVMETPLSPEEIRERLEPYVFSKDMSWRISVPSRYPYIGKITTEGFTISRFYGRSGQPPLEATYDMKDGMTTISIIQKTREINESLPWIMFGIAGPCLFMLVMVPILLRPTAITSYLFALVPLGMAAFFYRMLMSMKNEMPRAFENDCYWLERLLN